MGGPLFAPIGYLPRRRRNVAEWNWAVEAFQELGDVLDAKQMTLAIEPVNRSETFFLMTASDAKAFTDAVNHPRVGVIIDTFHANIEERISRTRYGHWDLASSMFTPVRTIEDSSAPDTWIFPESSPPCEKLLTTATS